MQDHISLLAVAAYQKLDKYVTENKITWPVVLLSEGHSSQFDVSVLQFCKDKDMRLFISPPNATSTTQLLDQINQKLHTEYRQAKFQFFTGSWHMLQINIWYVYTFKIAKDSKMLNKIYIFISLIHIFENKNKNKKNIIVTHEMSEKWPMKRLSS